MTQETPYAKKSLGQHWLHDVASLDAMCDGAHVTAGDIVLEIGPGTGTLTERLLDRGATVIAIELDDARSDDLVVRFRSYGSQFQLHRDSILTFDLTSLPPNYLVVANIPYYLTSNLIRTLSETTNRPRTAVLLVQKEVAERVAAAPGDMSLLSVTAQYYWQVSLGLEVPARLFTPPPKVDSQILILERRAGQLFENTVPKEYFRVVKAGFSQRRKTILNSLSGGLQLEKTVTHELIIASGLSPTIRPQQLSLEDWYRLYHTYSALPKA